MKYILLIASMLSTSMVYAQTRTLNEPEKRPAPIMERKQREVVPAVEKKEQKENARAAAVEKVQQRITIRFTARVTQLNQLSNRLKVHFEKNAASMKTEEAQALVQQADEKLSAVRARIAALTNTATPEEMKAIDEELKGVRSLLVEAIRTFKSVNSN